MQNAAFAQTESKTDNQIDSEKIVTREVIKSGGVYSFNDSESGKAAIENKLNEVSFLSDEPERYNADINNLQYVTDAKNQGGYGTCWSFAATACVESGLLKEGKVKDGIDLSEMHADYALSNYFKNDLGEENFNGFNRNFDGGGNSFMYESYITKDRNENKKAYNGPVAEDDFKYPEFEDVYSEDADKYIRVPKTTYTKDEVEEKINSADMNYVPTVFSDISFSKLYLNEPQLMARNSLIKEAVKKYGAVEITIYSGDTIENSENGFITENEKTLYYFNDTTKPATHSVTIVGFDDEFKKENFNCFGENNLLAAGDGESIYPSTPVHDGAFIVKNSWGNNWGNNGYFYMSYDTHIMSYSYYGNFIERNSYDNMYDYTPDILPVSGYSGVYNKDDFFKFSITGANIFPVNKKGEKINKIGLFIYAANTYARFYIDDDAGNTGNPNFEDFQIVDIKTDGLESDGITKEVITEDKTNDAGGYIKFKQPGYYILELEEPVTVFGDTFTAAADYKLSKEDYTKDYTNTGEYPPLMVVEASSTPISVKTDGNSYRAYSMEAINKASKLPYDLMIKAYTVNPKDKIIVTIDGVEQEVDYNGVISYDGNKTLYRKMPDGSYEEFDRNTKIVGSIELFTNPQITIYIDGIERSVDLNSVIESERVLYEVTESDDSVEVYEFDNDVPITSTVYLYTSDVTGTPEFKLTAYQENVDKNGNRLEAVRFVAEINPEFPDKLKEVIEMGVIISDEAGKYVPQTCTVEDNKIYENINGDNNGQYDKKFNGNKDNYVIFTKAIHKENVKILNNAQMYIKYRVEGDDRIYTTYSVTEKAGIQ